MGKFIDLTGRRIGRWKILKRAYVKPKRTHWLCECECGVHRFVCASHLLGGKSTQCKTCHNKDAVAKREEKHGNCRKNNRTREYRVWNGMKTRCYNPNSDNYKHYGERGIAICQRWKDDFNAFLEDMGKCPANLTIDRIDNDKDYEPSNCRWATRQEQNENKSNCVKYEYKGEMVCITKLSKILGIPYTSLARRIKKEGWPFR